MNENLFSYTSFAIETALKAGNLLMKGFQTRFSITNKTGAHNLVTEYDIKSEKLILDHIQKKYPHHNILSEERGEEKKSSEYEWIIDPLDGTVNFAHSLPIFSVSIALRKEEEVVVGVVYVPTLSELFIAQKGAGAYLNGRSLQVSKADDLRSCLFAVGFPYDREKNPNHMKENLASVLDKGTTVRRLGSAAVDLAYVAAGRNDGYFEAHLEPWDAAAGILLVEEAGGMVSNWKGTPYQLGSKEPILATNRIIHSKAVDTLSK